MAAGRQRQHKTDYGNNRVTQAANDYLYSAAGRPGGALPAADPGTEGAGQARALDHHRRLFRQFVKYEQDFRTDENFLDLYKRTGPT